MAADSAKNYSRNFFSFLLAASVLGFFIFYRQEVSDAFKEISLSWAVIGLSCFLINYCFRAARVHVLTKRRIAAFPDAMYCSSTHGFATYMLPMRTGELSLPFILKSTAGIELKEGAAILYKARLLDVLVLGFWLIAAAILPYSKLPITYKVCMAVLGLLMVSSPVVLGKLSGRFMVHFKRISGMARAVAESSRFDKTEIMLSVTIWIASAAMLWSIAAAMHLSMSMDELLFLVAIQLVMQLFPIQGFANSGNHESGWMAAMMMIGYPADISLQFALASHAIVLVFVLFLGFTALILRYFTIR
jgi:hypothetical protein